MIKSRRNSQALRSDKYTLLPTGHKELKKKKEIIG